MSRKVNIYGFIWLFGYDTFIYIYITFLFRVIFVISLIRGGFLRNITAYLLG